jgi:hypothetical protein
MSSDALYVGSTSTRPATSSGCLTASAEATTVPMECPNTTAACPGATAVSSDAASSARTWGR